MDTAKFCPHCGKRLDRKAIQGLCPECFLKVGLGSGKFQQGEGNPPLVTRTVRFLPPSPQQLSRHFPQLEIISLIGQGGMGAVYKARQKQLDRLVALKILPTEVSDDPAFAERFTREARALARLSHRNIVAVHDFGQTGEFYYFIMEFIAGLTLRELMLQHKLAPNEALAIVPQICGALQYAHAQGVVHRDIKPENILVDKQGEVKITDFGLAMLVDATAGTRRLTQAREIMGTPNYMAPEQVERPREVDHRADIYSLGVVFYEMLTGELPLGKFAPPSRKVHIDVRLDEVVLHALEKEPEFRYQQAKEVKTDVETIVRTGEQPAESEVEAAPKQAEPKTAGFWKSAGAAGWAARILGLIGFLIIAFALACLPALMSRSSQPGAVKLAVANEKGAPVTASAPSNTPRLVPQAPAPIAHSSIPPVVIKTVPESGASDVDPQLSEIAVTFSSQMKDKQWSWSTWGEGTFPETTGEARYLADGRTCVLPVKLKSGKVYATWINSDQLHGFQDRAGQAAVPYLLVFETRKQVGIP